MAKYSFRQKILISLIGIFFTFTILMYLASPFIVKAIVHKSIRDRVDELIVKIRDEPDEYSLVQKLKDQKYLIFFRVSIIAPDRRVLYDSYMKRLLGPAFNKTPAKNHPEVEMAFTKGVGYHEGDSKVLQQRFVYLAKSFDFHGTTYVLRTAFPHKFVLDLSGDIGLGLIGLFTLALLLFSCLTWAIMHHLTQPVQQIITAIKPYQNGETNTLPEIDIGKVNPEDDFSRLAETLNSLSAKIQSHIDTITHERNEKSAVLESLVEGVIAINSDMVITYANNAALKLLEKSWEDLFGKHFIEIGQAKCYDLLQECQNKKTVLTDTLQIKREGYNAIYLDLVAAPKSNDGGAILVMEDKTAHHKLLEMRRDFVANASHELKTPITIIRGFAETLHDNPQLPAATFSKITGKILHSCQRMGHLVKDLLTLTDVENIPHSRLIECDLYALLEQAVENVQDLHPKAKFTLHKNFDEDVDILADPNLLELAVMNLLENAVKYSQGPAEISVSLQKEGEYLKIDISDKGIGIPAEDIEHIFQRFYTVDKAHSRKLGGSGLGLSIVETIIKKHFGRISVASQLGVGSTFTIHLPINNNALLISK